MSFCIFKHRLTYAKGEELLSQVRNGLENGSLVASVLGLMAAVALSRILIWGGLSICVGATVKEYWVSVLLGLK